MIDWMPLQIFDLPTVKTKARSLLTFTGTLDRSITCTGTLNTTRLALEVTFLVAVFKKERSYLSYFKLKLTTGPMMF